MAATDPPIHSAAMTQPLFLGDPQKQIAKFESATGLLAEYRNDFCSRILEDPEMRQAMVFLPAALWGQGVDEARQLLLDHVEHLERIDLQGDSQFHTWCTGGRVTRRAAFFDWLAARDVWTQPEIERAADAFLGFAYKHSYQVLTLRGRSSNNQPWSMILNCIALGFLFGYKLSGHALGRFLFAYGMSRVPDIIGLFPRDGYGGEGSTYTSHVNTPLACWTDAAVLQLTGEDLLHHPFAPNGTTLHALVDIERLVASPGGLLAPWDNYGWQPERNACAFAYLAQRTGDTRYLSLIDTLAAWPDPGYLAWGADDPMWTLIWWPDDQADFDDRTTPTSLFGWHRPRTGAALDDAGRKLRLMQVWDMTGSTISNVGRLQVNPNHLMLDYAGEAVFGDGTPDASVPLFFKCNPDDVFSMLSPSERDRYLAYRGRIGGNKPQAAQSAVNGLAAGLIGASNSIVVDDEGWYWPGSMRIGKSLFYGRNDALQAVSSDCANMYERYGVTTMRRTSVWTGAGFGLVVDTVDADSEHDWRWQVFVRNSVDVCDTTAKVSLPNGHHVMLAWEAGETVESVNAPGFPREFEGGSVRLGRTTHGNTARFVTLIAPDANDVRIENASEHVVTVNVDGKVHHVVVDNADGGAIDVAGGVTTAAVAWRDGKTLHELAADAIDAADLSHVDTHDLPDIDAEADTQLPLFARFAAWRADNETPPAAGNEAVAQVDACYAQLAADTHDESLLFGALASERWPIQLAAVDVIGRLGVTSAAPRLRDLLEAEQARTDAELYPPMNATADDPLEREAMANRWRRKAALITALGRLHDREAVGLIGRVLADGKDFYGPYSAAALALGRIGGEKALAALAPALDEMEVNTRARAEFSRDRIREQQA